MSRDPDEIRASSILPARRTEVVLHTADDLRLVGELALPAERDPAATLVTLHPLPTHGGFMDSHVFKKAAYRLPALADVAAAIEYAEFHEAPELPNRWLVGWSFGTDLALMYGNDPSIDGAILLSPPLRYSSPEHLAAWADSGKPLLALVPELDDYLRPQEARERFGAVPQAEVVGVDGAKHLWVGEPYVRRVHEEIVRRVNPAALPLKTTWPATDQQHEPSPATRLG